MSILVVGSVAYDNLETPSGKREKVLGGTATNFSMAASFFTTVHIVGAVGDDFEHVHLKLLSDKGINISGLEIIPGGKTFHWSGHYMNDLNQAETLDTRLGVFADFDPKLSEHHSERPYIFLAPIHPELQLKVLSQIKRPKLIAMDTMNLWINTTRDSLQKVIEKVDMIFVNNNEARDLTKESNITRAALKIMEWGPKAVIVKRGEYGAVLYTHGKVFAAPALPITNVVDPTGAGDTFAGGFLGYIARAQNMDDATLRRAVVCGSVMASFQVEDFGTSRLQKLCLEEIDERFREFSALTQFEPAPVFV